MIKFICLKEVSGSGTMQLISRLIIAVGWDDRPIDLGKFKRRRQ